MDKVVGILGGVAAVMTLVGWLAYNQGQNSAQAEISRLERRVAELEGQVVAAASGDSSEPSEDPRAPSGSPSPGGGPSPSPTAGASPTPASSTEPAVEGQIVRGPLQEVLLRNWSVDLDTGRQSAQPGTGIDIQGDLVGWSTWNETEFAPVTGQPVALSTCLDVNNRISDINVWNSGAVTSGEQFCIFTDEGNVAHVEIGETRSEPRREVTFTVTLWDPTAP